MLCSLAWAQASPGAGLYTDCPELNAIYNFETASNPAVFFISTHPLISYLASILIQIKRCGNLTTPDMVLPQAFKQNIRSWVG
jgi:hypothetical protein